MLSFLRRLARSKKPGRSTRRGPQSVQLGLLCLEGRVTPSATGVMSATTDAAGQAVVFNLDTNGAVWRKTPSAADSNVLRSRDGLLPPTSLAGDWKQLSMSSGSTAPSRSAQRTALRCGYVGGSVRRSSASVG